MAHPDISLLGAVYSDVSGVTLPKSGGGTATFPFVEGSQTITTNNTYDVTNLAQVIVNVAGGGGSGLVYETGTYTPASDTAQPTISFANSHSSMPFFVLIADTTGTAQSTNNSELSFAYINWYMAFGQSIKVGSSTYYARRQGSYKGSSSMSATGGNDTSNSSSYVSSTTFKPSNGSNYYWRSGRTYKWIAVWAPTT